MGSFGLMIRGLHHVHSGSVSCFDSKVLDDGDRNLGKMTVII